MPIVRRLFDQKRVTAGIHRAERMLAPDVKRILYNIAPDWTGEESLFFRIVLSDEASAPSRLGQISQRVTQTIDKEIKSAELGLQTYFNFRSKSETDKFREAEWEV